MSKILIDVSHNESITSFPEELLDTDSLIFQINTPTDDLSDLSQLKQYDLIFLGNAKPKNETELLFKPEELAAIKKYVKEGGSLLITSGSRGDYNFENTLGSLRVFFKLTGVASFHYSTLFGLAPDSYYKKKTNIVISQFPKHPIFNGFNSKHKIVFGKPTTFSIAAETNATVLLRTGDNVYEHSFLTKKKQKKNNIPLITVNELESGKVLTIASSSMFTRDPDTGFTVKNNKKFVKNIFNWLLNSQTD